ncbi:hypothetical protein MNBD_PLANCTO02-2147 [hydrothermal vent metagenome]|uniref:1,4-dihydroxy-6-naphtoate synthase n=1 Tax=hydrothermal vent metagenome TaxID=652676 RepID=A0A3B1DHZ5_9ZZZZ
MTQNIKIAYTPDSDDAFYYYAMQNYIVGLPSIRFQFEVDHIINLNRQAEKQTYDVSAISSVFYPKLAERYRILSVGSSIGRGYGPVLVSQKYHSLEELKNKRVAVAGIPTTGGFLAKFALPNAELVERQFDLIADDVVEGKYDAGVMIHEELLYYPQKGLHKVADLGEVWQQKTALPLPVGLNVISRHLEESLMQDIADCIRESLGYALTHKEEALAWALQFGRGEEGNCGEKHIAMFANADSVMMPEDVREGLQRLYQLTREFGLTETIPPLDIVDGSKEAQEQMMQLLTKLPMAV